MLSKTFFLLPFPTRTSPFALSSTLVPQKSFLAQHMTSKASNLNRALQDRKQLNKQSKLAMKRILVIAGSDSSGGA